jgi:hypothetical protein
VTQAPTRAEIAAAVAQIERPEHSVCQHVTTGELFALMLAAFRLHGLSVTDLHTLRPGDCPLPPDDPAVAAIVRRAEIRATLRLKPRTCNSPPRRRRIGWAYPDCHCAEFGLDGLVDTDLVDAAAAKARLSELAQLRHVRPKKLRRYVPPKSPTPEEAEPERAEVATETEQPSEPPPAETSPAPKRRAPDARSWFAWRRPKSILDYEW